MFESRNSEEPARAVDFSQGRQHRRLVNVLISGFAAQLLEPCSEPAIAAALVAAAPLRNTRRVYNAVPLLGPSVMLSPLEQHAVAD